MKRFLCFLALLACFSLSALAVPKVDGRFGPREYDETMVFLQSPQHESNNNLSRACLYWTASSADQSVYLALQYSCTDHTTEDSRTGVMVFINDELIGTIHADGSIDGVDHGRFEFEGFIDDGAWSVTHDSFCEIRIGIKFWQEDYIYAGFQILDFGGNPSNYYRQLVYSPYTTTTEPEKTTTTRKATTQSSTAESTTMQKTTAAKRTTAPVITASPSREAAATTAAASDAATVLQPAPATSKATTVKTTKPKTTKVKSTKSKTTKPSVSETTASAAAAFSETEPTGTTAPTTTDAAPVNAQMYRELNKVKIVGTVLVAVILTAAVMSSVFLGMRQRKADPEKRTPQEEYDDFG